MSQLLQSRHLFTRAMVQGVGQTTERYTLGAIPISTIILTNAVKTGSSSSRNSPAWNNSHGGRRSFTAKAPGPDPLELFRLASEKRNLCDEGGYRRPGTHWVFTMAVAHRDHPELPPNLRTLGIQRVSDKGVEFVMKRGFGSNLLANGQPVSFLHRHGRYKPGETVEQWRAEGICEDLPLGEIVDKVPHYTLSGMVASARAAKEKKENEENPDVSKGRSLMDSQSHYVEIIQATRVELENGEISNEEIEGALRAYRLVPERMERMIGGPDAVMWDRWEWIRSTGGESGSTTLSWAEPKHLLPY